jgi:4-hydroxy-tetrahydrodipicolinate synthase
MKHFFVEALEGSLTPLLTPLRDGSLDLVNYAMLIEHQIHEGSNGIVVNGTSGEPSTLTLEERNRLIDVAVHTVRGRCPVIAATGSQSHAETCALTEHATRAGVDALLIVTPYYLRPPQRGLIEYFIDMARRSPLPQLIYHIPGRAAVSLTFDSIAQIVEQAPNVIGLKHAANDLVLPTQCLAHFGMQFRVFVGLEELSFPMMAIGACGVMNAVGNVAPARVAALCTAVRSGDFDGARRLHFELFELNQAVFYDTNPIPIKYMARRLGLISANEHRLPLLPAAPELERRLDEVLRRANLLSQERTDRLPNYSPLSGRGI